MSHSGDRTQFTGGQGGLSILYLCDVVSGPCKPHYSSFIPSPTSGCLTFKMPLPTLSNPGWSCDPS